MLLNQLYRSTNEEEDVLEEEDDEIPVEDDYTEESE